MKSMPRVEAVDRRHVLGATAFIAGSTGFGIFQSARAETDGQLPSTASVDKPAGGMAFGDLKQVEAGALNVGFVDAGPDNGPAVILLHGWPYDIHSYADVTPILESAGFRVIVPYFRGYGSTHFLASNATQRATGGAGRRHRGTDGRHEDSTCDRGRI